MEKKNRSRVAPVLCIRKTLSCIDVISIDVISIDVIVFPAKEMI